MSRGFALYELGEFQKASEEWSAAVRLNSREAFAHAALAVGLYEVGKVDDAKTEYDVALALDLRYAEPTNMRIDIRWTSRALQTARRLTELLRTEPRP